MKNWFLFNILHQFHVNYKSSSLLRLFPTPVSNPKIPSFCLLLYSSDSKLTSVSVQRRWKFIIEELNKLNIKVRTFSSDSDTRYNSAMRGLSMLGTSSNYFPNATWFSCGMLELEQIKTFYVQDTPHYGVSELKRKKIVMYQYEWYKILCHLVSIKFHNDCYSDLPKQSIASQRPNIIHYGMFESFTHPLLATHRKVISVQRQTDGRHDYSVSLLKRFWTLSRTVRAHKIQG